ncbi:MAG TPA: hypothetical protein VMC82_01745 [Thermoplasmata archaeon]|nr:hypothetical protein [Thermoplasmata archaeon]
MRFGYDGAGFRGWARQPGQRTVEGEIRRGLVQLDAIRPADLAAVEVASRTDRGVSARANALVVPSELDAGSLLERMNAIDPEIFFSATVEVDSTFRVRAARRRIYRYFDPTPDPDLARRREVAAFFAGSIDVRSLGRGIPGSSPVRRWVESVTVRPLGRGSMFEVRAPSFVWGMVRKIVGSVRAAEAGRLDVAQLRDALAGRVRLSLPMAESDPLVLWDVEYPLRWTAQWSGRRPAQLRHWRAVRAAEWARGYVLRSLEGGSPPPPRVRGR